MIQRNKSWICPTHFTDEETEAWRCGKPVPELAGGGEQGGGGGPACLLASAFIAFSTCKPSPTLSAPLSPPPFVLSRTVSSHGMIPVTIPWTHKPAEQPALTPLASYHVVRGCSPVVSASELWTLFFSSLKHGASCSPWCVIDAE